MSSFFGFLPGAFQKSVCCAPQTTHNKQTFGKRLVRRTQECPANNPTRIEVASPVGSIIMEAITKIAIEAEVIVIGRVHHVYTRTGCTPIFGIDHVGNDTGEYNLAKPLVAMTVTS
jgi:hypothetical protein